jgi:hypothetical protein
MGFPFAAMGIGALIGGLTSKQRGGNFLKGALQGAALGGAGGMLGGLASGVKAGTTAGGIFGFGKKMMPNMLAMAGIGLGSEMMGQSDANRLRKLQQRKWLEEEEERRLSQLSGIAGYDVADSANFLNPAKFFSARGGLASRPHYQGGGIGSLEDDPMDAINVQEMMMQPGTISSEDAEDFDYMEMAGDPSRGSEAHQVYEAYLLNNNLTELQLPFETFVEMWRESAAAGQGEQQGPMMAAEGGIADLDMRGGGHSIGPGTGTSDDVPAMLSDGEFVMTANAVENLGGGDRMTGARRMYQMMNQLDPNSQTPAEMTSVGYG